MKVYPNNRMSLSVIITASFVKSHPSIEFIKTVIESLELINLKKDTPIILAHDFNKDQLIFRIF
jgi:hypothetical protein